MKKYFYTLVFLSLIVTKLFAQAPQGLNYQAVALRSNGTVLANHAISLQLSVIDSIANGNAVYTETQNTTTDAFGLFSVVIGNGTATLGTFATINWGKNYKFLKTEIDTTAGNSFVLMGITQFMSTPYALYSNNSKFNYNSIQIPDGLQSVNSVLIDNINYTVLMGKTLYLPSFGNSIILNNSDTVFNVADGIKYVCLKEGTIVRLLKRPWQSYTDSVIAFTVNKSVDWKFQNIVSNPLIVPAGKSFIIINAVNNSNHNVGGNYPKVSLNGTPYFFFDSLIGNVISSGNTLSAVGSIPVFINGYFIDN
jgi:hypothetical protein